MPDYLSVKEAAEKLDITQVAVRTLIQKGKLEGAFQTPNRAWVIPADSVSAYKASRRDEPKKPRKPTAKAKRETSNKKKETKKRSSRKSSSSGFGLDDILKLITDRMNKSDKPQSGNLLTTAVGDLRQSETQRRFRSTFGVADGSRTEGSRYVAGCA